MERHLPVAAVAPDVSEGAAAGPRPERTAASGWVLRAAVTAHLLAGFGQPAFAGVYLSGNFDGLGWHALGADLVSYIGVAQIVAAIVVWVRVRRVWPFVASVVLTAGETAQYFAGLAGALWLHIPLGVTLVGGTAGLFAAIWMRPLPRRRKAVPTDD